MDRDKTNLDFADIQPWDGKHDTGADVRQKWHDNFEKIKAAVQSLTYTIYNEIVWFGDVLCRRVDRGAWSQAIAENGGTAYRYILRKRQIGEGENTEEYQQLEQHTVYHLGCKWACVIDKTTEEPSLTSTGWQFLEGDTNIRLYFDSTNGWTFKPRSVNTIISVILLCGTMNATDYICEKPDTMIEWTREGANPEADRAWKARIPAGGKRSQLLLTNEDMGPGWAYGQNARVKFTCTISRPEDGNATPAYKTVAIGKLIF